MYSLVTDVIGGAVPESRSAPIDVRYLVVARELSTPITATLTEQQWRMLQFALERAAESL